MKNYLKKSLIVILAIAMLASLVACTSQTAPAATAAPSTGDQTEPAATTEPETKPAASKDNYPNKIIQVIVPSDEGGAMDRAVRAFTNVWSKKLGVSFQVSFYPGASGQVGYELFTKAEPDGYTLLCGNIGPEMLMYATQDVGYKFPDDYVYFGGMDADPAVIWVAKNSPINSMEELIALGKTRTVTLSTSRYPHPSTLAALLLAQQSGADFSIIPYGGGAATRTAGLTGEVDAVTTNLSSSLELLDEIKILMVFNDTNEWPDKTQNAPVPSDLGYTIPAMGANRAWAVSSKFITDYPERYALLASTFEEVMNDPQLATEMETVGMDPAFLGMLNQEECTAIALGTADMAAEYKDVLSGK